jgi:hypothetical protein
MIPITQFPQGNAHGNTVGHNLEDTFDCRAVGSAEWPPVGLFDVDQVYPSRQRDTRLLSIPDTYEESCHGRIAE